MTDLMIIDDERAALIKRTIAKGATDDELELFIAICRRTGLDPFARQIYAVKRWDSALKREVLQTQVSIDGMRLQAERSGRYEGQLGPFWCGRDGEWLEVWLDDEPPAAAKVGVLRAGFREPLWAVARLGAYIQTTKDNQPNRMWRTMPDVMLAKCAESLALRRAFPAELSGLYSVEEMGQADEMIISEPPTPLPSQENKLLPRASKREQMVWRIVALWEEERDAGHEPPQEETSRNLNTMTDEELIRLGKASRERLDTYRRKEEPLFDDVVEAVFENEEAG